MFTMPHPYGGSFLLSLERALSVLPNHDAPEAAKPAGIRVRLVKSQILKELALRLPSKADSIVSLLQVRAP